MSRRAAAVISMWDDAQSLTEGCEGASVLGCNIDLCLFTELSGYVVS